MPRKYHQRSALSALDSSDGPPLYLQRRLTGYSAAAAATVAVLNAGSASAETIVWDIEDQVLAGSIRQLLKLYP